MANISQDARTVRAIIATLRRLRMAYGFTQEQVAKAAKLHGPSIARFETGKQKDTSFTFLRRYLRGLRKLGADIPPIAL